MFEYFAPLSGPYSILQHGRYQKDAGRKQHQQEKINGGDTAPGIRGDQRQGDDTGHEKNGNFQPALPDPDEGYHSKT